MDSKQRRIIDTFNEELQSLLEAKPPVSKTKMVSITRAAMKGVKYYKHIVQIVEKFIFKCRPEYKVPGLYVIDSIVRQSRHQFGIERDVYAARFSRNIQITFNNLFIGCLSDDRPKIVRVLNLWQKNGVFNSQVIQPLMDMANPNSAYTLPTESTLSADSPGNLSNLDQSSKQGNSSKYSSHQYNNSQYSKNSSMNKHTGRSSSGLVFDKSLLDFDYDEDDDDFNNDGSCGPDDGDETPTEAEPPLSSTLNKIEMEQRGRNDSMLGYSTSQKSSRPMQQTSIAQNNQHANIRRDEQDPVLERWNKLLRQQSITNENSVDNQFAADVRHQQQQQHHHHHHHHHQQQQQQQQQQVQRQRSRSPPNRAEDQYNLRQQPEKEHEVVNNSSSPRQKSPDRRAERKNERLRKCLPPIRDKHLTVCSSTLWLGHVPKTVSEADISDAFGEFGSITSIDLIPPRGCAYVCMDRRQDAKKALSESRDLKLNGSHIKMAWAPGKGFKEYRKFKDFWEVSIGSSYIPYNKIDSSIDFDKLEEGGVIDEDSMSMEMREIRERKIREKEEKCNRAAQSSGISLPIPTLPILSQPPPTFSMSQSNQMTVPPPSHLHVTQTNPLAMPPQPGQLGIPPPQTTAQHQLTLQQAGLALSQADMMLPQPNLSIPPPNLAMPALNMIYPGQLQFTQQRFF